MRVIDMFLPDVLERIALVGLHRRVILSSAKGRQQ